MLREDQSDPSDPAPARGGLLVAPSTPPAGGSRELLSMAVPLIVSHSFMTVQVFVDTLLLSRYDARAMAASFPAVMWFWLPFGLLQATAGYTSTFVAQYTGAGRAHRVGPAVWQGIHFAIIAGLMMLLVVPAAPLLIAAGGHSQALQPLEVTYLQCLAVAALPMLVMAAINGFFSGRGQTWIVLLIEGFGTAVNIGLALALIFGRFHFPELGLMGAGWATIAGTWASALLALAMLLRRPYREAYSTLSGWRPDRALFARLMKYGGPAGAQVFLDVLVFNIFVQLVGRLGEAPMGASTLTMRLNMAAYLPIMGLGQAVCILVGLRVGADRPDLAEKSAYTSLRWTFGYMCVVAFVYLTAPGLIVSAFESDRDPEDFAAIAELMPALLACVSAYSVVESVNVTFANALRGAGDTRYVSLATFCLGWPVMVVPTFLIVRAGGSVIWAWCFATAHIAATAVCFYRRFRSGRWKAIRVIETESRLAIEC